MRDVATVGVGAQPKFGDAIVMGRPGVLLTMLSQYGSNTMDVTQRLEAALEEMKPVLAREGITLYPRLHRPATFIETSLGNIGHSLLVGAGLVAAILFLFLGQVRTALISLLAIPRPGYRFKEWGASGSGARVEYPERDYQRSRARKADSRCDPHVWCRPRDDGAHDWRIGQSRLCIEICQGCNQGDKARKGYRVLEGVDIVRPGYACG